MKRNTNAVVAAFERAFVAKLASFGIHPARKLSYHEETLEFEIDTTVGRFTFHPEPQIKINGRSLNFIGAFGRFHEPDRAKKVVDCNPFTGKYNWQGLGHIPTVDWATAEAHSIARQIARLMPKTPACV